MTSSRERQLTALNTVLANLQRVYVFDAASARMTGTPEDDARRRWLRASLEAASGAFGGLLDGRELDADTRERLRPLAARLREELDGLSLHHDVSAPAREQAAFAAAHAYAVDNQVTSEAAIAQALGRRDQADWLQQQTQRTRALVRQANEMIESSVQGEPSEETAQTIRSFVHAARAAESEVRSRMDEALTVFDGPGSR